jgi:hypothetical protein
VGRGATGAGLGAGTITDEGGAGGRVSAVLKTPPVIEARPDLTPAGK